MAEIFAIEAGRGADRVDAERAVEARGDERLGLLDRPGACLAPAALGSGSGCPLNELVEVGGGRKPHCARLSLRSVLVIYRTCAEPKPPPFFPSASLGRVGGAAFPHRPQLPSFQHFSSLLSLIFSHTKTFPQRVSKAVLFSLLPAM